MAATQREVIDRITAYSMRVLRGMENEDLQGMAEAWREAQRQIIELVHRASPGDVWTLPEMQGPRLAELFQQINRQLDILNERMVGQLEKSAVEQLAAALEWSTYGLDQATPMGIDAQQPSLPVENIRALVNTPYKGAAYSQRYGLITDQMAADVRGALAQSMINGESMKDAAARIEKVMGADSAISSGYANRSLAIARSEIMRAQNIGRVTTFDANKDLMAGLPEWVAVADDRLCPWCLRRDGMSVEEIEASDAGEDPHGNSTDNPLHTRCRCTWVPRLKTWRELGLEDMPEEYDDDERGMRNADGDWVFQPVESFDKWKEGRAQTFAAARAPRDQ